MSRYKFRRFSSAEQRETLIFFLRLKFEKILAWNEELKADFEENYTNDWDPDVRTVKEGFEKTSEILRGQITLVDTLDADSSGEYVLLVLKNLSGSEEKVKEARDTAERMFKSLVRLKAEDIIMKILAMKKEIKGF